MKLGLPTATCADHNQFAAVKPWDGKTASDKHLLIWSEQGLGDSLQFVRYAELCKQRVSKVSVLCQKPLVRLFNRDTPRRSWRKARRGLTQPRLHAGYALRAPLSAR